jgi:hypothetical protein
MLSTAFRAVVDLVADDKTKNVVSVVAGMGSLLVGNKLGGLSLFAKGAIGLERHWRRTPNSTAPSSTAGTRPSTSTRPPTSTRPTAPCTSSASR